MCYVKLLLKNRRYVAIALLACFVLCFVDTKSFGMPYRREDVLFRLLTQQVFFVFLCPILILSVLNEKFLRIQKDYMVLYTMDEKVSIKRILTVALVIEILLYILGQILFQGIYYLIGQFDMESLKITILSIFEIATATYISVSILLFLKKDLFSYTIFYILIILMFVLNNPYITMPMTIKSLDLLGSEFLSLLVSRFMWLIISFIVFQISLKRYSKNFFGEYHV